MRCMGNLQGKGRLWSLDVFRPTPPSSASGNRNGAYQRNIDLSIAPLQRLTIHDMAGGEPGRRLTRIIHGRGIPGEASATLARSASEGKSLRLPRLRFGLVFRRE